MIHEAFRVLVVQYKLVTIDYFMDKMEDWEMIELFNSLQYADSNSWEQTRFISYLIAQTNSKKKLNIYDIMKFPWEETQNSHNIEISNNDVSRLKSMANNYIKYIQNTNNGSTVID